MWTYGNARLGIGGIQFIAGVGASLFLICSGCGLQVSANKNGLKGFWSIRLLNVAVPFWIVETVGLVVTGMGSIVTKDVGPYEIWAGNPARLIRKRFPDETIEKLQHTEWWNWTDEKIERTAPYFTSPTEIIEKAKEQK